MITTISPSPADVGSSSSLMTVLTAAQKKQKKESDSFLSVDQVLRALAIKTTIKDTLASDELSVDALYHYQYSIFLNLRKILMRILSL